MKQCIAVKIGCLFPFAMYARRCAMILNVMHVLLQMGYGVFCRMGVVIKSVSSNKYLSPLTLELEDDGIDAVLGEYAFEYKWNNSTHRFDLGTDDGDIGVDLSSGRLVHGGTESASGMPEDHGFYFMNPPRCRNMIGYSSLCMQEVNGELRFSKCHLPGNEPASFQFIIKTIKNFKGRTDTAYTPDQTSTQDVEARPAVVNASNRDVDKEIIMDSGMQNDVDVDLDDSGEVDSMLDYQVDGSVHMDDTNENTQGKCSNQHVFLTSVSEELKRRRARQSQNSVLNQEVV